MNTSSIHLILISVITFLAIIFISYNYLKISSIRKRIPFFQKYITDFDYYIKVLDYHMTKAYDIIYKDRMLVYSLEATKLNEDEFKVVAKDFLTLVLKILGPNLIMEFITLYGNEETFFFNITEYFNTRFEDDEIRKTATLNISNIPDMSEQKP